MQRSNIRHLGLIPDGARRWARRNALTYYDSYWFAMRKLVDILDTAYQQGVLIQSVYLLSTENLGRSPSDLAPVFETEQRLLNTLLPGFCDKWDCSVHHAGLKPLLPSTYADAVDQLCTDHPPLPISGGMQRKLYLLIAYNPWDELEFAIKNSASPQDFREKLWVTEELDLVIRTAEGQLLSNFLPLQSGYAELHFMSALFNDVEVGEVAEIIATCNRRLRLMGH